MDGRLMTLREIDRQLSRAQKRQDQLIAMQVTGEPTHRQIAEVQREIDGLAEAQVRVTAGLPPKQPVPPPPPPPPARRKLGLGLVVQALREGVKETGGEVELGGFVQAFDAFRATGLSLQASALAALLESNKGLAARLQALEQRPASLYRGIHEPGVEYQQGEQCTRSGGLWIAERATTQTPGVGASDWKLIVKRGRG